jgi:hypothetical protein
MLDPVERNQAELIRRLHPDWEEERVLRLAGIWARRARRIFWGSKEKVSEEVHNPDAL